MTKLLFWLVLIVLGCGTKTPPLQSHNLPKGKGKTFDEPKCSDNPPTPCPKVDLQCTFDERRACYVCQCQMNEGENLGGKPSQPEGR